MSNLKDIVLSVPSKEVQELTLVGELKEGLIEETLVGGVRRIIHVSTQAIRKNVNDCLNLPTIIVRIGERNHEAATHVCHAVRILGPALLKPDFDRYFAHVHFVTHNELVLYCDPNADSLEEAELLGCYGIQGLR